VLTAVLPSLPIFKQLVDHAKQGRTAIVDYSASSSGDAEYSYTRLLTDVAKFRDELSDFLGKKDLQGERVAFLVESGYNYVVTILTVWALGGFAVPLCTTHPIHEMLYTVTDSDASVLLATEHFEPKIRELADAVAKESPQRRALYIIPHHPPSIIGEIPELVDSPIADPMRHALMIYTSGTTGKPKVLYHRYCGLTSRVWYQHIKQCKPKSFH
jgi:acyl-coenzyme A synthetase/AMP-(fatty) acid ligase